MNQSEGQKILKNAILKQDKIAKTANNLENMNGSQPRIHRVKRVASHHH